MLHRVEVDVVEMAREVVVIADGVFPEPPLPQGVFALCIRLEQRVQSGDLPGEQAFDPTPAAGEIGVALRKGEHCVEVVGEDDNCVRS